MGKSPCPPGQRLIVFYYVIVGPIIHRINEANLGWLMTAPVFVYRLKKMRRREACKQNNWPVVGLTLGQRRRRWPSVELTKGISFEVRSWNCSECLVTTSPSLPPALSGVHAETGVHFPRTHSSRWSRGPACEEGRRDKRPGKQCEKN